MDIISYEQIAAKLLQDNYILTALELHLELIESGKELPKLKEYFSNPGNFERQALRTGELATSAIVRSQSQATLDSLDVSRISEDDMERTGVDERVAVLEFELRKAKDCIKELRANLTEATEKDKKFEEISESSSLKTHEQRALNFLVNEYLLQHGYRLTAVTFSEENENQDFEDWDDVGINVSRPPELSKLYKEGYVQLSKKDLLSQYCQTENIIDENELALLTEKCIILEQEIIKKECEYENVQMNLEAEKEKIKELEEKCKSLERKIKEKDMLIINKNNNIFHDLKDDIVDTMSSRVPEKFREELYNMLKTIVTVDEEYQGDVHLLLTDILPKIVQSLPSNRKQDLIPLISTSVICQTEGNNITKLINVLLNLRKRPDKNERKAILKGICDISKNKSILENYLIPQVWDLAGNKVIEKRILAAEICSAIAPFTNDLMKQSQLLPLLQTILLEANEEQVKYAIVENLSILITYIDDSNKYLQCEELAFLTLKDTYINVQIATLDYLLPVISHWALQTEKLHTSLIYRTLSALSNDPENNNIIQALINMLPYLIVYLIQKINYEKSNFSKKNILTTLFVKLNNPDYFYKNSTCDILYHINFNFDPNNDLVKWIIEIFLPNIYNCLAQVKQYNESNLLMYKQLYDYICKSFGQDFTKVFIKPQFINELTKLEEAVSKISAKEDNVFTSLITIPILLNCVLTTGDKDDEQQLFETIRHLLLSLSTCNLPIFPLKFSLPLLCKDPDLQDNVLNALITTSKHSRCIVRLKCAQLIMDCVSKVNEKNLLKYIMPSLSMLSNDNDSQVLEVAVELYAEVIAVTKSKEAETQSKAGLQAFLKDCPGNVSYTMLLSLTRSLGKILPVCDLVFREEVVLPHIFYLTTHCLHSLVGNRKSDLGLALKTTLSTVNQVEISKKTISMFVVPALRNLEAVSAECLNVHHDAVSSWLREAESRCNSQYSTPTSPTERLVTPAISPASQIMQNAVHSATAAGRRSVEDVKQKVTNLLRKK